MWLIQCATTLLRDSSQRISSEDHQLALIVALELWLEYRWSAVLAVLVLLV